MIYSWLIYNIFPFLVTSGTAVFVDYGLSILPLTIKTLGSPLFISLIDNIGHGILASVSWLAVRWIQQEDRCWSLLGSELSNLSWYHQILHPLSLFNVFLCGFLSCLLDVDHFLMASSFTLQGAMSLSSRPFGHSVTFIVAVCGVLYSIRYIIIAYYTYPSSILLPVTTPTGTGGGGADLSLSFPLLVSGVLSSLGILIFVAWFTHQLRDSIRRGLWIYPFGSTPSLPYPVYLFTVGILPYIIVRILRYTYTTSAIINNHYQLSLNGVITTNVDSNGVLYVSKTNEL